MKLQEQQQSLRDKIWEKEQQIHQYQIEINMRNTKEEEITLKLSTLETQICDREAQHQEDRETQERQHTLKLNELQQTLSRERAQLEQELTHKSSSNQSLKVEVAEKEKKIQIIQQELVFLKQEFEGISKEIEDENTSSKQQADYYMLKYEQSKAEYESLQTILQALKQENTHLKDNSVSLHRSREDMEGQISQIRAQLEADVSKSQKECEHWKQQYEQVNKELQAERQGCNALKKENELKEATLREQQLEL